MDVPQLNSVVSNNVLNQSRDSDRAPRGALGKLARGTSIYVAGTVVGKLLLLAIQVLLARQLRISAYGLYNLGFNAMILLQSLALMGLDQGVLRYSALYRTRGEIHAVKGTFLTSLWLGVLSSVVISGVLILVSPAVSTNLFREPRLTSTLQMFSLALPFYVVARITGSFAQSHHDIVRMTAIQQVSQPVFNLLFVGALFFLGGGLKWASIAFVFATALNAAVGLYSIRSVLPECFSSMPMEFQRAELLKYSLALSTIAILYQLAWRVPSLLIGHLAGAREVGLYSAAAALASPPGFISSVFAQPFMPMMVDLHEQRNLVELKSLYRTVVRWTSMLVIPGFGFLMFFRKPLLALFGRDFKSAGQILATLGLAWMVYYAKGPVDALLDMTGHQIIDLGNVAGVLVLSLTLGLWWIPRAGAVGAGWAIAISILAWSLAEIAEAWILFRLPPLNWHFFQSLLFAVVAFGLGALLPGRAPLAVQALTIGCLYAGLIVAFGLTASDRDLVRRGIKKATSLLLPTSEAVT